MQRAQDIKDKLAYTLLKYNSLNDEISAAQKEDKEVPFVGQKTGDILSGCRECFDYCAKDMADTFVTQSANRKVVDSYVNGDTNAYFPFYKSQLKNGKLFFELSTTAPALYHHLLNLTAKIEAKQIIPNTMASYGVPTEVNNLVNEKKHDKITTAKIRENAATHVMFPGGGEVIISPLFQYTGDRPDFGADLDAQTMIGTDGVKIKYVRDYKLSENNWEIRRFCLHAILSTTRILTEIYHQFFGSPADHFDPWETIKPENVKKAEGALKAISPIASHPIRIVLLHNQAEAANIELSFEGEPTSKKLNDVALAKLFLLAFEYTALPNTQGDLQKFVFDNWETIDVHDHSPRYCELTQLLQTAKEITINGQQPITFDQILWGIGLKFCCTDPIQQQPNIDQPSIQAAIALVNSNEPRFSLLTDGAGNIKSCRISKEG